jgi:hypothetical protein
LLQRDPESLVQCLVSQVEVTEQADQSGEDAARLGAVDSLHHLAHWFGRVVAHYS